MADIIIDLKVFDTSKGLSAEKHALKFLITKGEERTRNIRGILAEIETSIRAGLIYLGEEVPEERVLTGEEV